MIQQMLDVDFLDKMYKAWITQAKLLQFIGEIRLMPVVNFERNPKDKVNNALLDRWIDTWEN